MAGFPRFSRSVATLAIEEPIRSAGAGVGALVGVPIALALVALTIVGLPLSIVGVVRYAIGLWIGLLYGEFAVGSWALSRTDYLSRWLAVLVGVLGVEFLGAVPILGGLLKPVVLLVGLGAVAWTGYERWRGRNDRANAAPSG